MLCVFCVLGVVDVVGVGGVDGVVLIQQVWVVGGLLPVGRGERS